MGLTVAALLAVIISTIHESFCEYHGLLMNKNVEATAGTNDTHVRSLMRSLSLDFSI